MNRFFNKFLITAAVVLVAFAARIAMAEEAEASLDLKARARGDLPDSQPYVFWAYGLTCFLLFLFMIRNIIQSRNLERRIDHLEGRFENSSASEAAGHDAGNQPSESQGGQEDGADESDVE